MRVFRTVKIHRIRINRDWRLIPFAVAPGGELNLPPANLAFSPSTPFFSTPLLCARSVSVRFYAVATDGQTGGKNLGGRVRLNQIESGFDERPDEALSALKRPVCNGHLPLSLM